MVHKSLAASVSWSELSAAISTNPESTRGLPSKTAAATIASLPSDAHVPWLPTGWIEDTTCSIGDIVSFSLWIRDPMYRSATGGVRRTMEMEEAAALLLEIDAVWKDNKIRGWVRKHLEEDLRDRAGGAQARPDAWETVRTVRRAALVADFVCIVRGLRVALWWPESSSVTCIPLTGLPEMSDKIYNLNCTSGHSLVGPAGPGVAVSEWPGLFSLTEMAWFPPACMPAIGATTVGDIHALITAIEPGSPKKGGRVALWNKLQWLRFLQSCGLPAHKNDP